MSAKFGVSVGAQVVRAILVVKGRIDWAGAADWTEPDDLTEAIARLAGEAPRSVRRVRVVLDRDVIQTRSLMPAPPVRASAVRRYVSLEAPRLFRKNGVPLVTDGVIVSVTDKTRALWAAAVAEPVVQALIKGFAQAGIRIDSLGPAADVLPFVVPIPPGGEIIFPNGGTAEVVAVGAGGTWRSRLINESPPVEQVWPPALCMLSTEAAHFAGAFGAVLGTPRLCLFPGDTRAARDRGRRVRLIRLAVLAATLWLMALSLYVLRLHAFSAAAQREMEINAAALDSTLGLRRELEAGRSTLHQFGAARAGRSRHLQLIAAITGALDDSTYLVMLRISADGTIRLAGHAPSALRAVAALERTPFLRDVRLDGPVTRERGASSRDLDRFAVVARRESP